ncbi:putative DMT superfamily transporter inner membrane protein [Pseudomonas amygdali pv. tabaci]|uniref:Putative DMT superfamily transporter inner membrane protein n=2 Tax=Pseudomonas TaxID=286 RepID=A0A3M6FV38_PSEAJ|nr:putative DMT superfamily transporter inner membrane protein [Pseudomonas amygdali pv. tabaci]
MLGVVFAGETIGIEECLAMVVIISAVVLIGLPQWRRSTVRKVGSTRTS